MKILVEIIGKNNDIIKKKRYKIVENHLIIEEASKGRGKVGYTPEITSKSILYYEKGLWLFKILKRKAQLIYGAERCVEYSIKEEDKKLIGEVELHIPTRETIKRLFNAEVLNKASQLSNKLDIPIYFTLLIVMSVGLSFLTFLVSSGRIRI